MSRQQSKVAKKHGSTAASEATAVDDSTILVRHKICFIGDSSTGKSTLFSQVMNSTLPKFAGPTIATDFAEKTLPVQEGGFVQLMAWDYPGDIRSRNATTAGVRQMAAVIFCYDPFVRITYLHIPRWLEDCSARLEERSYLYLIAIKRDLTEQEDALVSAEEAEEFAEQNGMYFYEVNAKNLNEVKAIFEPLFDSIQEERSRGQIVWSAKPVQVKKRVKKGIISKETEKVKPSGCYCCKHSKK